MPGNTTNFSWYLPTVGGDADVWGEYTNDNWTDVDALMRRSINNFIASSAPLEAQTGTIWLDNATNPNILKIYDGSQWVSIGSLNTTSHIFSGSGVAAYVGDMKFSAQGADHGGWLLCDGSSISTTTYSGLFALIGYNYGGSGATFNLPDMRGRVPGAIGTGTGLSTRTMGEEVGEETHVLTTSEMAAHNHETGFSANSEATARFGIGSTTTPSTRIDYDAGSGNFSGAGPLTSTVGSSAAHNNMQPTLFVGNYFIYSGA
jgi:microcystin-dependent protein